MLAKAQPIINTFGEMVARKLFSRTWQHRDEALNEIENTLLHEGYPDQARGFVNAVGAIRFTLGDKMAQVS